MNPLTDFGFKKLFEAAEIARFSPQEREAYENSLKHYRDIKNVVDTSKEKGREEGLIEEREEGAKQKSVEIAKKMKVEGFSVALIVQLTGLTDEDIAAL